MNTRDPATLSPIELTHYIGGKRIRGSSGRFGDVYNPSLGVLSGRVPLASKSERSEERRVGKECA